MPSRSRSCARSRSCSARPSDLMRKGDRHMRFLRSLTAAGLIAVVAGCDLEVTNPNNPDRGEVLGNPADVEALAASQFQQMLSATLGRIPRVPTGRMAARCMERAG